ncbi:hypothetical protein OOZ63_15860 [Paucibacter sp. PLA-PC-4]|uniref:hypothetical protein n=1 Tax=Paucibacter sp. PLA-PC-4 TaxID=2993655 RepID=UPI002248DAFE|nr:hypothetical protein [Paucibacter sp. PLA-PC-4]MCX2863307.1 hypothetical protein [Paucibacter sp. PLA-PC-4]
MKTLAAPKSQTTQRAAAAAAHAGPTAASTSPRQSAQGAQIAQLQALGTGAPVQRVEGDRRTKGFNRGKSHSTTTPSGKVKSHKPGKGREEDPRKSAAKNRRRDRMLAANVANSQNK